MAKTVAGVETEMDGKLEVGCLPLTSVEFFQGGKPAVFRPSKRLSGSTEFSSN